MMCSPHLRAFGTTVGFVLGLAVVPHSIKEKPVEVLSGFSVTIAREVSVAPQVPRTQAQQQVLAIPEPIEIIAKSASQKGALVASEVVRRKQVAIVEVEAPSVTTQGPMQAEYKGDALQVGSQQGDATGVRQKRPIHMVLRAYVKREGTVQEISVLESSGDPEVDAYFLQLYQKLRPAVTRTGWVDLPVNVLF